MSIEITSEHITALKSKGWISVPLGLTPRELLRASDGARMLEEKATELNYPYRRTYFPSLIIKNTAAVEAPFNKVVNNDRVRELFLRIKLGKAIKSLLGWNEVFLVLSRLFTMSSRNYLGHWHRDHEGECWNGDLNALSSVQVAIYLFDQPGFRILKPEFDFNGSKPIVPYRLPKCRLPQMLPSNLYDEVPGNAGTVVFFAPGLAHQGHSVTKRLDFHMRFSSRPNDMVARTPYTREDFSQNIYQDFWVHRDLSESVVLDEISTIPRIVEASTVKKIINDINYYLPVLNFYKSVKSSGSVVAQEHAGVFRVSLFANTLYQSYEYSYSI